MNEKEPRFVHVYRSQIADVYTTDDLINNSIEKEPQWAKEFDELMNTLPVNDYRVLHKDLLTNENRSTYRGSAIKSFITQLLHSQQAHWLRSEIEKLEGEVVTKKNAQELVHTPLCRENPEKGNNHFFCGITNADYFRNQALTSIITRYKEELKVLESNV